jgi:TatA/E family protein of Tat protein translocase
MGPLGWQETLFIFILALLLFGPKKLPELGKTIGKAMSEFRRASAELKSTFDREMSAIERESESLKEVTSAYNYDDYSYNYNYESSSYDSGSTTTAESVDSTATNTPTASASATQGAESPTAVQPEGAVASGTLAAAATENPDSMPQQSAAVEPAPESVSSGPATAESQAVKS